MAESLIEGTVVNKAVAAGWFTRKVAWIGRRDAPDRMFAKDGRVVFIEFKDRGKTLRPGQVREAAEMRAAGIEVHEADSIMAAMIVLRIGALA